jgi:hypothetical protein
MELTEIENSVRQLLEKLNKTNRYVWLRYYRYGVLCGIQKQSFTEVNINYEVAKECLKLELDRIIKQWENHIELQKQYPFNI